jgi:hypothetical protein
MTPQQNDVLLAVIDLMNGGMDMEEALGCYAMISKYVVNTVSLDSIENEDNRLRPLPDLERQEIMWRVAVTSALETGEAPYAIFAQRLHSYLDNSSLFPFPKV